MITAVFTDGDDCVWAYGLWQWDYGQQLRIEGLHLPTVVEIHFSLQEAGGEAVPRVGVTKDGVTTVTIPDSMLEGTDAVRDYQVYAWVYLSDRTFGETTKQIMMKVKARSKPKAFDAPGDGEIFHEAIEAVNDAAKRAEEAGDKAVSAADEAKAAATQTAEHLQAVQKLSEQVEINADTVAQDKQTVAGMLSQTQQAASDAALSAQEAKLSETAAVQAQAGAEAAEDGARQYAEDTGADRQAVANDKQAVSQMREAVAADRQAVEQTALQFGQTAQDALTAIGQAQSTAVGAVKAEGNKQTTAVQEAGTQAVSEVTEAKTTAVEAVTTEGDTQTKRVEDAAAGIVADREQINQNKTDIAGLVEGMTDLAPAIHSTASGSVITANDAAEGRPFRGLRVFGRTEQVQTTGAQLINTQGAGNSRGVDWVFDKGVVTFSGVTVDTSTNRVNCAVNVKDVMEIGKTYFAKSFTVGIASDVAVEKPSGVIYTREYTPDGTETGICIRALVGKSNDAGIEIDLTAYVAITENERLSSWEPYTGGKPSPSPEYPQEIVSVGESGNITVDVTGRNLFDGKFESGNIRQDNGENQDYVDRIRTIGFIPVIENTSYLIKPTENTSFAVRWYDIDKKFIKSEATNTITKSPDNAKYMRFILLTSKLDTKCAVYAGSKSFPYEPYREPQTLTLQTPNGLPGVPVNKDGNYTDKNGQQWICDEIDLGRGKYMQRTDEKDVSEAIPLLWSGAGKWGNNDGYKTLAFYAYINGSNSNKNWDAVKNYGICNYAIITSNVFNNSVIGFSLGDYIAFRIPRSLLPDWDENNPSNEPWANWLKARKEAGNPVIVRYALANPIERDLTPEEIAAYKTLHTNYPSTVISNDAGAHMEVSYVADTKNYIDNKFAALNKAVLDAVGGK